MPSTEELYFYHNLGLLKTRFIFQFGTCQQICPTNTRRLVQQSEISISKWACRKKKRAFLSYLLRMDMNHAHERAIPLCFTACSFVIRSKLHAISERPFPTKTTEFIARNFSVVTIARCCLWSHRSRLILITLSSSSCTSFYSFVRLLMIFHECSSLKGLIFISSLHAY